MTSKFKENNEKVLELKLNQDQMEEIDLLKRKTFDIYNFNRAMMIMLVKEMAANRWQFEPKDPIKLEFDPKALMVRISIDEKAESVS